MHRLVDRLLSPRWRGRVALLGALALVGCATPQMQAQWRDPQVAQRSLQGKAVLVLCRGFDMTLERICEDRLAADAAAVGIRVLRADPTRELVADPAVTDALLKAARAAQADGVLAMRLSWSAAAAVTPGGSSVGVGIGAGRGTWSGGTSGAVGITLPLGGSGPTLAASTTLTDAATGKLLWSGRAVGSGAVGEVAQVGELTRLTAEALRGAALF